MIDLIRFDKNYRYENRYINKLRLKLYKTNQSFYFYLFNSFSYGLANVFYCCSIKSNQA